MDFKEALAILLPMAMEGRLTFTPTKDITESKMDEAIEALRVKIEAMYGESKG